MTAKKILISVLLSSALMAADFGSLVKSQPDRTAIRKIRGKAERLFLKKSSIADGRIGSLLIRAYPGLKTGEINLSSGKYLYLRVNSGISDKAIRMVLEENGISADDLGEVAEE